MVPDYVDHGWCSACQADVEVVSVAMGTEGIERPRCANCGTYLDESDLTGGDFSLEGPQAAPKISDRVVIPNYSSVLVVGYAGPIRDLILDHMTNQHLARELVSCENGEEMIIQTIQHLAAGGNGSLSLIVLEVPMPFLNGINAAIGLRAVEKKYPSHTPIPILFLTHKPCDDTFKKVIKFLSPAKYAGLGPSTNPAEVGPRLERIISLIAREKW